VLVAVLLVAFVAWVLIRRRQNKGRFNEVNAYDDIETTYRSEDENPFDRMSIPMPPASYIARASVRPPSSARLTLRSVDIMAPRVMSEARLAQHQPVWRIVREDPFADPVRDSTRMSTDPFRDPSIGRAYSRDTLRSGGQSGFKELPKTPTWQIDQRGK
jgi:hypothetical protein